MAVPVRAMTAAARRVLLVCLRVVMLLRVGMPECGMRRRNVGMVMTQRR